MLEELKATPAHVCGEGLAGGPPWRPAPGWVEGWAALETGGNESFHVWGEEDLFWGVVGEAA